MLTSIESMDAPGKFENEDMHVHIQLQQQQQPPQHTLIFVKGDGPKPVPKLNQPTCCCGCNVATASTVAAIIHALITWNIFENLGELEKGCGDSCYATLIFFAGMTLCYAGIAFCRTEQLCSIIAAVNHLFSIPMYLAAVCSFYFAYKLQKMGHAYEQAVYFYLYAAVFSTLMACTYTYMANKYQEFGEYLNKENKQYNM